MIIDIGPTDPGFLAAAWLTLILSGVFWASVLERRTYQRDRDRMVGALLEISRAETPKANATVRRMVDIAEDALDWR